MVGHAAINVGVPDPSVLRELLDYDAATGLFTWKWRDLRWFKSEHSWRSWNTKHAGKRAFTSLDTHGYHHGRILGRTYLTHKVAWAWFYDEWPEDQLDHENHTRTNNAIKNLREADNAGNAQNQSIRCTNTSGHTGVVWYARNNKWAAQIKVNGVRDFLGLFADYESAVATRKAAEIKYGFHPNHGKDRA